MQTFEREIERPKSGVDDPVRPWMFLLIPLAFVGIRIVFAALLELHGDEAYYWTWSRSPAGGYFDHPPMVAWLIRISTSLFGDSELAIRLPAILLGAGSMLLITWIAAALGARGRARILLQLVLFAFPLIQIGAAIITPDAPAQFFVLAAVAAGIGCLGAEASIGRWLTLGVMCGLAMLSKYTAVVPVAAILLFLAIANPRKLAKPVLAGIAAVATISPMLVWNARHGWISFAFQLSHGTDPDDRGWYVNVADLIGSQFAVATPLLAALLIVIAYQSLRGTSQQRLIAWSSLATLGFFLLTSLSHKVEANWPAIAWPPLLALLPGWAHGASEKSRRFLRTAVLVSAASVLVLHMPPTFVSRVMRGAAIAKIGGWKMLATRINAEAQSRPIITTRYQDAALLSYYLPGRPAIGLLRRDDDRRSQFDLWRPPAFEGEFLLVSDGTFDLGLNIFHVGDEPAAVEILRSRELKLKIDGLQRRGREIAVCRMAERDPEGNSR